jgi:hypothetical protein
MTRRDHEITFTVHDVQSLRDAYEKALKDRAVTFDWRGHTFVTAYARYLLQYLESVL